MIYLSGLTKCRICSYKCVAILESETGEEIDMECAGCGNMSLEFVTEEEWENDSQK